MKRIEDAPKELQKVFWDYFEEDFSDYDCSTCVIEHIFLRGFDTAMATNGLPQRPKRTISRVITQDGSLYVLSSDGRLFMKNGHLPEWVELPDLPQED